MSPLKIERLTTRLTHWLIYRAVVDALKVHDQRDEEVKQTRIYGGVTKDIEEVSTLLTELASSKQVKSTKLFVRLSCVDGISGKYYVVSIYQSEKLTDGRRVVVQFTWLPKRREPVDKIKQQILEAFSNLVSMPKNVDSKVNFRQF